MSVIKLLPSESVKSPRRDEFDQSSSHNPDEHWSKFTGMFTITLSIWWSELLSIFCQFIWLRPLNRVSANQTSCLSHSVN